MQCARRMLSSLWIAIACVALRFDGGGGTDSKEMHNKPRALYSRTIRRQSFGTQSKNRSACCVCLVKTNADAHSRTHRADLMASVRAATQPNAGGVPGARHSHMFMARNAAQAHAPVPVGLPATTDPRDAITD